MERKEVKAGWMDGLKVVNDVGVAGAESVAPKRPSKINKLINRAS